METVQELVEAFRDDEKDAAGPNAFWSDPQLVRWARQAVDRYCEITRSVYDSTSPFTCVELKAGDTSVPRHPSIIDIVSASFPPPYKRDLAVEPPGRTPRSCLPTSGITRLLVVDSHDLRLYPPVATDCVLQLEVIRRPVRLLTLESRLTDVPPHARETLLLYMKHRAYRVHDAELFDPAKAADYLAEFERECQEHLETARAAPAAGLIKSSW
jgi:hypothetical protein